MPLAKLTAQDLKREVYDFQDTYPKLERDHLFVLWFLRAYIVPDENQASKALSGGSHDKGIDAVLIEDDTKSVFVVQGKYHVKLGTKSEKHADVISFAQIAARITGDQGAFADLCKGLAPQVQERIAKARQKILKSGYRLHLMYVTTGKCSPSLVKEATQIAKAAEQPAIFELIDWRKVLGILDYYLIDVAPPVRSLDLEIEGGNGVNIDSIYHRYDAKSNIDSWVFSMAAHSVAEMYAQTGRRLFALNIRGYLGSKEINKGMEDTLEKTPEYFWYYNNGLTIVCDHAERIIGHGKDILRAKNPQVINGQQTTRTLDKMAKQSSKASVTVRVIRIPHDGKENHFDVLVPEIVQATNRQNAITASDLISNDPRQVEIQRQMRKLGYWYVRKLQSKSEAAKEAGALHYYMIGKEDLAQAIAGCDLDPAIVREGKKKLFKTERYQQLFPTSDPYYYLCRYWLMTCVSYAARGYPERAYAKWLVLNFVWSNLGPLMNSKANRENFRRAWEYRGDTDTLDYLWYANNAVYRAALQFYRLNRGKGATAQDISTFFKIHKRHEDFEKFWKSTANSHRAAFDKAWAKFEKALAEEFAS
jgi:hypothetical protein